MSNVTDIHDLNGRIDRERHRVVEALRMLTEQIDSAPRVQLVDALPIAARGVEELRQRLAPWLPSVPPS